MNIVYESEELLCYDENTPLCPFLYHAYYYNLFFYSSNKQTNKQTNKRTIKQAAGKYATTPCQVQAFFSIYGGFSGILWFSVFAFNVFYVIFLFFFFSFSFLFLFFFFSFSFLF